MPKLNTIVDADFKGKKVLLRVDFNLPVDPQTGEVADETRMEQSLPTIRHLLDQQAKIIVVTHLGRPQGKIIQELRLDPIASKLSQKLNQQVTKLDQCIGPEVEKAVSEMKNGEIIMLENVRFEVGEEKNDPDFAQKLALLADIYVCDAFGVVHRAHASVSGIAEYLPCYAGFLLEKEITQLSKLLKNPEKPVTLIMGGAKIDTKIDILKNFIGKADYFLIGGGLANTFLAACGYNIAQSLYEKDKLEIAREIMLLAEKDQERFILPKDVIVASEISENTETLTIPIQDVEGDMKILDIGPMTRTRFHQIIAKSETIIWNGPMGLYEYQPFQAGTRLVADELAKSKALTVLGGGDTIDAINKFGLEEKQFHHISTGGGAMLEFLGGRELPGLKALYK